MLILGDFNGRTGEEKDYIELDDNIYTPVPDSYRTYEPVPSRCNSDQGKVCENGKRLIELCKSSDFVILNGRKIGDTIGNRTCFKYNGSSVVDYAIVNRRLWADILYFKVHDKVEEISDYCPIFLFLAQNVKLKADGVKKKKCKVTTAPQKVIWTAEQEQFFREIMS